jgi:alpha-1,3/alpha-1,6-mannosyltransferase
VFLTSISNELRKSLLINAACVLYTPTNEHFGIVPCEAMYCNVPVIADNSGGPK